MDFINDNPFKTYSVQSGTMVYEIVKMEDKKEQFAFLIKEDTQYINKHMGNPKIELRTGLMKVNNVWVIPIMLLFGEDFDMLYETYFNYYQTDGGKIYLDILQNQDIIPILFYNEKNENVRQVLFNNQLKSEFEEFNMRLNSYKPWEMEDFDVAKSIMYKTYPSPLDLWNKMSR